MRKVILTILGILIYFSTFTQTEIELVSFAEGFDRPVDITAAGDGRLYITEQDGKIHIIDENGTILPEPFLDILNLIDNDGNEQGLLGLVFHPDYANNGYFYVNYTETSGDTRISRFSVSADNPDLADPNSELILMAVDQPFNNHNAGDLDFGPDGYLYFGLGDGGSGGDPQNHSQNRQSLLGKMIRIDVNNGDPYTIPDDNPFVNDDFTLDEIWAVGLRNPWRFSFDRLTGDMWIADVGQDDWEEIDFQLANSPGGENYGWRCYEGNAEYDLTNCADASEMVFPIHEYVNTGFASVTGGYVYRGTQFPDLYGKYIYTDFVTGEFWTLSLNEANQWENVLLDEFEPFDYSTFGEDDNGEIYVAGLTTGIIYHVTSTACSNFLADLEVQNESCEGVNNGAITDIIINNGTAPYTITPPLEELTNLAAGVYSITVLDAIGCEIATDFTIEVNTYPAILPTIVQQNDSLIIIEDPTFVAYQWYLNGEAIEGATTPYYIPEETGNYTVEGFFNEHPDCGQLSEPFVYETSASTYLLPSFSELSINPNPFKSSIAVQLQTDQLVDANIMIQAIDGRILYEKQNNISPNFMTTIDLADYPNGIYILSIHTAEGSMSRKLVKTK